MRGIPNLCRLYLQANMRKGTTSKPAWLYTESCRLRSHFLWKFRNDTKFLLFLKVLIMFLVCIGWRCNWCCACCYLISGVWIFVLAVYRWSCSFGRCPIWSLGTDNFETLILSFSSGVHHYSFVHVVKIGLLQFVTICQPVNAIAFVADGLYYGVSDFAYAAYSTVLIYTPTLSHYFISNITTLSCH